MTEKTTDDFFQQEINELQRKAEKLLREIEMDSETPKIQITFDDFKKEIDEQWAYKTRMLNERRAFSPYSNWDEFSFVCETMLSAPYHFAKTMPKWPHWYTLRFQWSEIENWYCKRVEKLRGEVANQYFNVAHTEEVKERLLRFYLQHAGSYPEECFIWDKALWYMCEHGVYHYYAPLKRDSWVFVINDMRYFWGYPGKFEALVNRSKHFPAELPDNIVFSHAVLSEVYSCQEETSAKRTLEVCTNKVSEKPLFTNSAIITGFDIETANAESRLFDSRYITASMDSYYTREKYETICSLDDSVSSFTEHTYNKLCDMLQDGGVALFASYTDNIILRQFVEKTEKLLIERFKKTDGVYLYQCVKKI